MTDDAPRNVDLQTEQAVLGAVLTYPAAWSWYAEAGVRPEDFYRAAHQLIWRAAQQAEARIGAVDGLSVRRMLLDGGHEAAVGGPSYLFGLTDGLPAQTRDSAQAQARHLRMLARSRELAGVARMLAAACDGAALGLDDEACGRYIAQLDAITAAGSDLRVLGAEQQVLRLLESNAARANQHPTRWGVPALDGLLDGIRPKRVYGVVARTSVGKTTFALHVAAQHAADRRGLLFVSLEMAAEDIVGRLARIGLREPLADRQIGVHADAYIAHYGTVAICDHSGLSLADVERLIRSVQRHQDLATLVIDYLGLLRPPARGMTAYEAVSENARNLKDVAKRTNVAIIPLVQVSRQQGGDGSEEVGLGAARDSGVLEEALDAGIGLRWLGACAAFSEAQRTEWRDVLFVRAFKSRHSPLDGIEHAMRRDRRTMALTPDESLEFPHDLYRTAKRAASGGSKGGY